MKAIVPSSNKTWEGKQVWTVGYGSNDHLNIVDTKVLPEFVCSNLFSRDYNPNLMICAGDLNGGKDSCNGDGGGPLLLKRKDGDPNEMQLLLGIVAYGLSESNEVQCGSKNTGSVYTKIPSFLSWIQDVKDKYESERNNGK